MSEIRESGMGNPMTVNDLKKALDALTWHEQMEFEMSERCPEFSVDLVETINEKIRQLAQGLTPMLLDTLQQDEAYVTWVIRLSPYVPGDLTKKRAQGLLHHPDSQVRYWAAWAIEHSDS